MEGHDTGVGKIAFRERAHISSAGYIWHAEYCPRRRGSEILYWFGYTVLMAVFDYLQPKISGPFSRAPKLALEDKFLAILMRLRLGLLNQDLADRCFVSPSSM